MLDINILPQDLKRDLKLMKLYYIINRMVFIILFFSFILSFIVIVSKEVLKIQADVLLKTSVGIKTNNTSNLKLEDIKSEIDQVKLIQKDSANWGKTIEMIFSNINSDTTIYSMNIDKSRDLLMLSGVAKTREALLNFKKILESNKDFSNINFPTKNLLEKQNINFDISMNIKFL